MLRFITEKRVVQNFKKMIPIAVLCLLSNCGGAKRINYKNPKQVTLAFYKALGSHDYELAKRLGTPETQKVLSLLQNLDDLLPVEERAIARKQMEEQLKRLKKATCEIEEITAQCNVCCDEKRAFASETLLLKKVDKVWLVHITKETLSQR